MTIRVEYLDNGIGILYIGTDIVTGDDIINSNKEVFSSEDKIKKYKYGLIDYRNINQFNVSNTEIEIIVSQEKEASKYIVDPILAVVAMKDLEFGLSRMWETMVELSGIEWETKIFREREKAEIWIKDKIRKKYNVEITFAFSRT